MGQPFRIMDQNYLGLPWVGAGSPVWCCYHNGYTLGIPSWEGPWLTGGRRFMVVGIEIFRETRID